MLFSLENLITYWFLGIIIYLFYWFLYKSYGEIINIILGVITVPTIIGFLFRVIVEYYSKRG
jgi:hypothetical protein